tara:strand:+ start:18570 stop:21932 length:3363 start_codon:yes stop_codon:yes gene_type:complete
MTKLNITNKRIYKLKKHKNQSKKKVPKKRKNKKRGRKGRSFRKRRKKYNIKNNSIKKYKKQKGGVITTTSTDKGKMKDTGEIGKVFKSGRLKALEKELGNEQRKIKKLNDTYKKEEEEAKAKLDRFAKNEELVGRLATAYTDMTQEGELITDALIEDIDKLHKEIGDDDDIKKLSVKQIKALKLNADIEHGEVEIGIIKPLLNQQKAKEKEYKNASTKKDKDVEKQKKAVIKPAELKRLQNELTELEAKDDEKKKYEKKKKSFDSKNKKSIAATAEIVRLNDVFNNEWGNWEVDDKAKKETFIAEHLQKDNMMQGPAKGALTYLDVIKRALKLNEDKVKSHKNERKNKKLSLKTIEKESKNVSDKINAETSKQKKRTEESLRVRRNEEEEYKKDIATLTKKEDEKLSGETEQIAKGFKKTGEFIPLDTDIKRREEVVASRKAETDEAVKEAAKLKDLADTAWFSKKKKREIAEAAKETVETKKEELEDERASLDAKKNWKKGVQAVGSVLRSQMRCSVIIPYIDDSEIERVLEKYNNGKPEQEKQKNGEELSPQFKTFAKESGESFRILIDQPYTYSKNEPYANYTYDKIPGEKEFTIFYNYYLRKIITSPEGKGQPLINMIAQRIARYMNYAMLRESEGDKNKSHKETIVLLNKKIRDLFQPTHVDVSIGEGDDTIKKTSKFRNHLEEKINALKFLELLLKQTEESFPQEKSQRYVDLMETTIDGLPLFNIFCANLNNKCYDDTSVMKQFLLDTAGIKKDSEDNEEFIKKGLKNFIISPIKQCEPIEDDNGELYLRVAISKGLSLYSKEYLENEETTKTKFMDAIKKYENNAGEKQNMKNEINKLFETFVKKVGDIKNKEYSTEALKKEIDDVNSQTTSINVVIEKKNIKINTEHKAQLDAAKKLLEKSKKETDTKIKEQKAEQAKQSKEMEALQLKDLELQKKLEAQEKALIECGEASVDEKRRMQEEVDKLKQEIDQEKAAIEQAKVEQETIANALKATEQEEADNDAKEQELSRKQANLEREKAELLENAKEEKDDDEDSDNDEFDIDGIVKEMGETPEDIEIEFDRDGKKKTIVLMVTEENGEFKIGTRTIYDDGNVRKDISDWNSGNLEGKSIA